MKQRFLTATLTALLGAGTATAQIPAYEVELVESQEMPELENLNYGRLLTELTVRTMKAVYSENYQGAARVILAMDDEGLKDVFLFEVNNLYGTEPMRAEHLERITFSKKLSNHQTLTIIEANKLDGKPEIGFSTLPYFEKVEEGPHASLTGDIGPAMCDGSDKEENDKFRILTGPELERHYKKSIYNSWLSTN